MKDIELYNDHFQNYKVYGIPKAQLIIADVPYNLGNNAYASIPHGMWMVIIRMEKAIRRVKNSLIPIKISARQNLCISVPRCL